MLVNNFLFSCCNFEASPYINRFLQPDTLIPGVDSPQSWNRFSYTLNNPIRYNDPSGHSVKPPTCFICNKTWFNYTSLTTTLNSYPDPEPFSDKLMDIGFSVGCFIVGCHVDTSKNEVRGPTNAEYGQQWANSFMGLATPLDMPSASFSLQERASALHNLLPEETQGHMTTAVVSAQANDGSVINIVASSEQRLRPAQRAALYANEIEAIGPGHAEVTALDFAEAAGLKPLAVAASRPICPECAEAILKSGALRITRLRMR